MYGGSNPLQLIMKQKNMFKTSSLGFYKKIIDNLKSNYLIILYLLINSLLLIVGTYLII